MAHVLVLSLVFPPDGVSTAQLMGELAVDLRDAGHRISVVTTQPHYNRDEVALRAQPLSRIWGGLLYRSSYKGIPVIHTRMPPKSGGIRRRLAAWLGFHVLGFVAALRFARSADVIFVPSPLLSAGVVAWLIGLLTGARYIYNVWELYPDLGIQLGQLRNPLIIAALRTLERFVYRTASAITVVTRGMEQKVIARGVRPERIQYVPNFVDVNDLVPMRRSNPFSREHQLDGHFVVSYAGNMGYAQGLDVLLDAADALRNQPHILFLFVGEGVARADLMRASSARQLPNVRFLEYQPYERVPEIYGASDLSVVPLLETIGADAIPSKVYRIMACGRPILAIASSASELASVVRESQSGVVVAPNAKAVVDAVSEYSRLAVEVRDRQGLAGRSYALSNVDRRVITARYDALVRSLSPP